MIDLKNQTIKVPHHPVERIAKWEVWFVTVEGTFNVWADAVASCERIGQPVEFISPVPVAIGSTTYEVALRQPVALETEGVVELPTASSGSIPASG